MVCDLQGSSRKGCGQLSQLPLTGSCPPTPAPCFKASWCLWLSGEQIQVPHLLLPSLLPPKSTPRLPSWRWPVTLTPESRGGEKEDTHTNIHQI